MVGRAIEVSWVGGGLEGGNSPEGIGRENVSFEVLRDPQLLASSGHSNIDFPRPTRRSKNVSWRKTSRIGW